MSYSEDDGGNGMDTEMRSTPMVRGSQHTTAASVPKLAGPPSSGGGGGGGPVGILFLSLAAGSQGVQRGVYSSRAQVVSKRRFKVGSEQT